MSNDDKAERMRLAREYARLEREYATNLITLATYLDAASIPRFRVSKTVGELVQQHLECSAGPCELCGVPAPLN